MPAMVHARNGFTDYVVQRLAQHLAAAANHIPVDPGGECLVLELLFDRFDFQVQNAFGGANQAGRMDESGQFVDGVEGFLHRGFGLGVGADAVAVAEHGADVQRVDALVLHDLPGLAAMFLGKLLIVQIVQQTGHPPDFRVLPGETGKVFHGGSHRQSVLLKGGCLGVSRQQVPGIFFG